MSEKEYVSFVYDSPEDVKWCDFVPFIELAQKELDRKYVFDNMKIISKDPDFHCFYADKVKDGLNTKTEDSLITMKRCPVCDNKFKEIKGGDNFEYNLSNYLDEDKQTGKKYFIYLHHRGEFEIAFNVIKGNKKADDPDGYIDIQISPSSEGIEIISNKRLTVSWKATQPQITVKLKVKKTKSDESNIDANGNWKYPEEVFQLDFFATDNDDEHWYDWKGKVKGSVHCGQFNIISRNCVCENWSTISSVIPISNFVVYDRNAKKPNGTKKECYDFTVDQIAKVNYKPATGWIEGSSDIFVIFKDANNDQLNDLDSHFKQSFRAAIEYLKKSLSDGIPSIAGVDDKKGYPGNQGDKTTDHFIVIVGMGKDDIGCYFRFFDNAVTAGENGGGTSSQNKLYCDCKNYTLKTIGTTNLAVEHSNYKYYQVTHIRKSIPL